MPNSEVQTVTKLTFQIRVTNLESQIARMRAEVVELLERRSAIGMRVVGDECPAAPGWNANSKSGRNSSETSTGQNSPCISCCGIVAIGLDPSAELHRSSLEVQRLKSE